MRRDQKIALHPPRGPRCAIYTRVSTDHGLDQEFNSLDAQREAAEAYVKSQAHEGWKLTKGRYDDGGYSGGSMERPALQQLLEAVRSSEIDIVVVYKVDRLTRSLSDFAKLVELFDAHKVSFVSVTQSFNTTTSMGRLTLNMLLSFAQFEREVTGERIRDKIAASKKRGLWVGGIVPFGYRVQDRKLVIDEAEAAIVRSIFDRYLELRSLPALQTELRHRKVLTRRRMLTSGRSIGGIAFSNGPLAHMLRNRVYLGDINHKGSSYAGEHQAIIDTDVFEAVQQVITANRNGIQIKRSTSPALLAGCLFDDRGNHMTPSSAKKGGLRYRYYISAVLAQGRQGEAGSIKRVSAPDIEHAIMSAMQIRFADHDEPSALVSDHLDRAVIARNRIELTFRDGEAIIIPWSPAHTNPRREILGSTTPDMPRAMKAEARVVLLRSIATGRTWLDRLVRGGASGPAAIARQEKCSKRHVERMIDLAFLAPDLVKAITEGRLPRGVHATALGGVPMAWSAQWQHIGLSPNATRSAER